MITDNTKFASRCRRNANILRKLAQTKLESREPLRRFAKDFDEMAGYAMELGQEPPLKWRGMRWNWAKSHR